VVVKIGHAFAGMGKVHIAVKQSAGNIVQSCIFGS